MPYLPPVGYSEPVAPFNNARANACISSGRSCQATAPSLRTLSVAKTMQCPYGAHVPGTRSGLPFSTIDVARSAALPLPTFFTAWTAPFGACVLPGVVEDATCETAA
jgi:hypothetical protein